MISGLLHYGSGLRRFCGFTILLCGLISCNENNPSNYPVVGGPTINGSAINGNDAAIDDSDPLSAELTDALRELVAQYFQQLESGLADAENSLVLFQSEVSSFLLSPGTETMNTIRRGWLDAHSAYELTSLQRYFMAAVLPEPASTDLIQLQQRINHWPILPGYIDYVEGYPGSGIVNDITVRMAIPSLRQQHSAFDLAEATLGFHVVEFLLWGANSDKISLRPASDFELVEQLTERQLDGGVELVQIPNNRRRQLLALTVQAILEDFHSMQLLWNEHKSVALASQQTASGARLLNLMTRSITDMLQEELLIASLYPLLNGNFVDSVQSPFSHSTQNAVIAKLSGVERFLLESTSDFEMTLDAALLKVSTDFGEFFYRSFDSSKECLVLLYIDIETPGDPAAARQAEFDIVECINLLTNMIDHLSRIETTIIQSNESL